MIPQYLSNLGAAFGRLFNALLRGNPNQSISSRVYLRSLKENPPRHIVLAHNVINRIFFWRPNHCMRMYFKELEYAKRFSGLVEMSYK